MSLPLHVRAEAKDLGPGLYKVLGIEEALKERVPLGRVLVDLRKGPEIALEALASFDVGGVLAEQQVDRAMPQLHSLSRDDAVGPGDAIRVQANGQINVL